MNSRRTSIPNRQGLTLIEVLVVMAIVVFFTGMGLFLGTDVYRSGLFNSDTDTIVTILQRARSQSLNNINGSAHGVRIDAGGHTLFEGSSYLTRDTSKDELIPAGSGLSFSGPTEIVFSQLSGESSASGSLSITNGAKTTTLNINYEGRIDF